MNGFRKRYAKFLIKMFRSFYLVKVEPELLDTLPDIRKLTSEVLVKVFLLLLFVFFFFL